jgi:predicted porin
MKKQLVAVPGAATTRVAFAQSSATLYGIVGAGPQEDRVLGARRRRAFTGLFSIILRSFQSETPPRGRS